MSRANHDRHITIFSPEGKLYQVEYAFNAAKNCPDTGLGFSGAEIACLVASKKVPDKLMKAETVTSMSYVTKSIGLMAMGRQSDCRTLTYKAREIAHEFFYSKGYEIPVSYLTTKVADHFQFYTQHAHRRCFGAEIVFCGWDEEDGPQIFHIDPAGHMFQFVATAIGGKNREVNNHLEKQFKDYKEPETADLLIEEAMLSLMKGTTQDFKSDNLEVMVASKDGLRKLTEKEIDARLTAISDRD